MDDPTEHINRAIGRLCPARLAVDAEMRREAIRCRPCRDAARAAPAASIRPPELDVDAEMRREAAHRLDTAAERMPDKPRIAALSLAFWLTTTATPEATEAARVLLGRADEIDGGAR